MTTNWSGILGKGWTKGRVGLEHVNQIYIHTFKWVLIGTAIAVGLGILLNTIGWKEGNFALALIFLIASTFYSFYPGALIWVFGIGSVNGLPEDWSLNKLIKEQTLPDLNLSVVVSSGLAEIKKSVKIAAHVTLFTQMFFVVLGTWELENSRVVIPIMVVLASTGLCTYLFSSTPKWYKRAAWGIMLTSLCVLIYNGYVYMHPQDAVLNDLSSALQKNEDSKKRDTLSALLEKASDGILLTPEEESFLKQMREEVKSRSLTGVAESLLYSKTLELEVDTVRPYTLCGVRPGKREFTIPHQQYILMDGDNVEVTSFVRVNGTFPNEAFEVDDTGCVQVSLAFTSRALGHRINPQVIQIAFK